ncbi:MAG: hypothetical protein ABIN94_22250 [Ferruginibacter sp.]
MRRVISKDEMFITFENRSIAKYSPQLSAFAIKKYGIDGLKKPVNLIPVMLGCYQWVADEFVKIIAAIPDYQFVLFLFTNHEASIKLYTRVLSREDIKSTIQIDPQKLALNRRILKLALEQTCDVDYAGFSKATPASVAHYTAILEDLLYLGTELIGFGQFLAEHRMIKNTLYIDIDKDGQLSILRTPEIEAIFSKIIDICNEDFTMGIFDEDAVPDMKKALQDCMGIDYDFAGGQIRLIKDELNKKTNNGEFQTIEPGILPQNLISKGVSSDNAINFYEGLTLSRANKMSLTESVYKVNAMERHFFRPILIHHYKADRRALIGMEKWAESIVVLATNGFQWNKAATEWKKNQCFNKYLDNKSSAHDKHLEDKVEEILDEHTFPYERNLTNFSDGKKAHINVDQIQGVGEMDFVWVDTGRKKIIVADCKYNRARYDMNAFSADYSNFKDQYEKKLIGKGGWVQTNIGLVCDHFMRKHSGLVIDPSCYTVDFLFVVNTPTFYMFYGSIKTVSFFRLSAFIENDYAPPDIIVSKKTGRGQQLKSLSYPYFT